MINFYEYDELLLEDIASFERAKKGTIYPRGSSLLQISATKGQIEYLSEPSEVPTKNVVIVPQAGINPKYFNIVLQKNVDLFMTRYATGINIQEHEISKYPIQLHNRETQDAVVKIIEIAELKAQEAEHEIEVLKKFKKSMLASMMV